MKQQLVLDIIKECNKHIKDRNIRNIGIGTNGSIPIPDISSDIPIHIYISRHHYLDEINTRLFGKQLLPIKEWYGSDISLRLNCNLIKGYIDSIKELLKYLIWAKSIGVSLVCFRELNKLNVENASMYPHYINEYLAYYESNMIDINTLMSKLPLSFLHVNTMTNGYDTNHNYTWNGIRVRFRRIDEALLLKWNTLHNEIDEYVIHPDGLVTGCWDRTQKVLTI